MPLICVTDRRHSVYFNVSFKMCEESRRIFISSGYEFYKSFYSFISDWRRFNRNCFYNSQYFQFHRHPHGKFATHLLSHCGEAILVSFVISPILCMPTYFVFQVNEKFNNDTDSMNYILDAEEDTWLYR